jgi:hypothetical protein
VLLVVLLTVILLVAIYVAHFFANDGRNSPWYVSDMTTTRGIEGVLMHYKTDPDNIATDTETGMKFVDNDLLLTLKDGVGSRGY